MQSPIYRKLAAQVQRDRGGFIEPQDRSRALTLMAVADLAAQNIVTCGSPLDVDNSEDRINAAIDTAHEQIAGIDSRAAIDDFERRALAAARDGKRNAVNDLFCDAIASHHETAYYIGLFVGLHFAQVLTTLPDAEAPQPRRKVA